MLLVKVGTCGVCGEQVWRSGLAWAPGTVWECDCNDDQEPEVVGSASDEIATGTIQ